MGKNPDWFTYVANRYGNAGNPQEVLDFYQNLDSAYFKEEAGVIRENLNELIYGPSPPKYIMYDLWNDKGAREICEFLKKHNLKIAWLNIIAAKYSLKEIKTREDVLEFYRGLSGQYPAWLSNFILVELLILNRFLEDLSGFKYPRGSYSLYPILSEWKIKLCRLLKIRPYLFFEGYIIHEEEDYIILASYEKTDLMKVSAGDYKHASFGRIKLRYGAKIDFLIGKSNK